MRERERERERGLLETRKSNRDRGESVLLTISDGVKAPGSTRYGVGRDGAECVGKDYDNLGVSVRSWGHGATVGALDRLRLSPHLDP